MKLLFKSNMKVGINRRVLADFEARALLPYLARCVLIVAFLKKINFIQRSRNALKLLFKSNMKVGINRRVLADFEARALLPYLARCVLIVAFLNKSNFIQRSRNALKLLFKSNMKVGINRRVLADFEARALLPYLARCVLIVAFLNKNNFIQRSRNAFKLLLKSNMKVGINCHVLVAFEARALLPCLARCVLIVAFLNKNNSFQRSRNALKLLFKSNMKVGINRRVLADFEARALPPYLARCVLIVAFLKKSIFPTF